jgi:hypothetical protein
LASSMQIKVTAPDGTIFLVEDASPSTAITSIAETVLREYGFGRTNVPYTVDILLSDSTVRRLDPARTLEEAYVSEGSVLMVGMEVTAGGDIVTLVASILSGAVGTYSISAIKLWLEERRSREIHIRHGDLEVTIKGALSERQIKQQLKLFRDLKKQLEERSIQIEVVNSLELP